MHVRVHRHKSCTHTCVHMNIRGLRVRAVCICVGLLVGVFVGRATKRNQAPHAIYDTYHNEISDIDVDVTV